MPPKSKETPPNLPSMTANGRAVCEGGLGSRGESSGFERWIVRKLLESMGNPPIRFETWDGWSLTGAGSPVAALRIGDRGALYRLCRNPERHFGDLYSEGRLDVDGDLALFLETGYRQRPRILPDHPLTRILRFWLAWQPPNTLRRARSNIHHHYDLGNDFYRLWLDSEYMQYTCAYFPDANMTLEEAQVAKMEHVCRKLELKPGDTVAEAGCGWGGFALYMAKRYGAKVKAYNISHEQIAYARERARQEKLGDRLEYVEDDYRNVSGEFDAFVSVGMLEHVGRANYASLGRVVDNCLKPGGRALIHSIGRNRPMPMNAWIEKRIFPGSRPPALSEMMDIFEPYDFSILDVENLRLHYAETLEHWRDRFEKSRDVVARMFEERFVRAWHLYLSGSIAAFKIGSLQLFQVAFARGTDNDIPRNRRHLYSSTDG